MRRIHEVSLEEIRHVHQRTYTIDGVLRTPWHAAFDDILDQMFEDDARHDHLVTRVDRRVNAERRRYATDRCRALFDRACERSLCRMYRSGGRKPRRDH